MTEVARDLAGTIEQPLAPLSVRSRALRGLRMIAGRDLYDLGSIVLLGILVILVLTTFRSYAITNDEWIQHRYGELIVAYYRSGFADRSLFHLYNLYLYGGLFDSVAVLLDRVVPLDVFDLRHLMSALIGVGGLGAALATARLIAGPRAGFLAGVALAVCGSWYGTMFHHTKDIPLAAAMAGAIYFLARAGRDLPRPRLRHVVGFGALTGAALGIKVLALLLVCYVPVAIALNSPAHCARAPRDAISFMAASLLRFVPALLIAYAIMIVAWPWSALAPLNPIRGLISFGDFCYDIRTVLDGHVYRMATVPRWYVPAYLLIKVPLLMLAGTALALMFAAVPVFVQEAASDRRRRDVALIAFAAFFPLLCEAIAHGPAFCGLRHFLFVLPPLAVLTGVGLDTAVARAAAWHRPVAAALLAVIAAGFSWNALTLYRLHPYEYVVYNPLVGGLAGASRLYATDYWATIMPEAVDGLEAYLAKTEPVASRDAHHVYTVAFCGERAAFLKKAKPHLHWAMVWETADFFIAPTHMNCDLNSKGRVVATVQRLGVPLGYVKDQRAMIALRHRG
ncbi:ArnT family glycosyltransferase [Nitrobacter sp.]|uniref:ArnT family glycosyltransferase n=1 Tax=Nitrobacter sp. TaxID=29420 RepID=UPI00399D6E32